MLVKHMIARKWGWISAPYRGVGQDFTIKSPLLFYTGNLADWVTNNAQLHWKNCSLETKSKVLDPVQRLRGWSLSQQSMGERRRSPCTGRHSQDSHRDWLTRSTLPFTLIWNYINSFGLRITLSDHQCFFLTVATYTLSNMLDLRFTLLLVAEADGHCTSSSSIQPTNKCKNTEGIMLQFLSVNEQTWSKLGIIRTLSLTEYTVRETLLDWLTRGGTPGVEMHEQNVCNDCKTIKCLHSWQKWIYNS